MNASEPYDVLGVESGSDEKDYLKQFRRLSLRFHQDFYKGLVEKDKQLLGEITTKLMAARDLLKNQPQQ